MTANQAFLVCELTNSGQTLDHETASKIMEIYTREQFEAGWRACQSACSTQDLKSADIHSNSDVAIALRVSASRHRQLTLPEAPPVEPRNTSSGHDDVVQANMALHLELRCGGKAGGCKICEYEILVEPSEGEVKST